MPLLIQKPNITKPTIHPLHYQQLPHYNALQDPNPSGVPPHYHRNSHHACLHSQLMWKKRSQNTLLHPHPLNPRYPLQDSRRAKDVRLSQCLQICEESMPIGSDGRKFCSVCYLPRASSDSGFSIFAWLTISQPTMPPVSPP